MNTNSDVKAEMPKGIPFPSDEKSSRSAEKAPATNETGHAAAESQDISEVKSVNEVESDMANKELEESRKFFVENLQKYVKMTYDEYWARMPEIDIESRKGWNESTFYLFEEEERQKFFAENLQERFKVTYHEYWAMMPQVSYEHREAWGDHLRSIFNQAERRKFLAENLEKHFKKTWDEFWDQIPDASIEDRKAWDEDHHKLFNGTHEAQLRVRDDKELGTLPEEAMKFMEYDYDDDDQDDMDEEDEYDLDYMKGYYYWE
ncbi:hypothetical protein F53441_7267 [Fusarium austroafricanum]|uniref:Uncharacterized protein n=1 Tax=Fusarium austroafricanum TaxID=2364996 RepID=A0A8H4KHS2_9HYPO|nr:hypothetical protein F53441_7267 [Fusarium austroafricanum]